MITAKHGTTEGFAEGCRCAPCKSAHMSAIAKASYQARLKKYGKKGLQKKLSAAAKMSHPQNNPNSQRGAYVGGRPPKPKPNVVNRSGN